MKTHAPGRFPVVMETITDCGESRPRNQLVLIVEDFDRRSCSGPKPELNSELLSGAFHPSTLRVRQAQGHAHWATSSMPQNDSDPIGEPCAAWSGRGRNLNGRPPAFSRGWPNVATYLSTLEKVRAERPPRLSENQPRRCRST